jgi:hypothetical protein
MCWWLKDKPAVGDLTDVRFYRGANRPTPRFEVADREEEESTTPCIEQTRGLQWPNWV